MIFPDNCSASWPQARGQVRDTGEEAAGDIPSQQERKVRGNTSKPATCGKIKRGGVSRWDSRVLGIPFPSLEAELGGLLNKPPDKQGGLWNISGCITAHTRDWGRCSRGLGESRGFIRQPGLHWLLRTEWAPGCCTGLPCYCFMFIKCCILHSHPVRQVPLFLQLSRGETAVNQEKSNEVLNTSISRSDGGRGELQIWKIVSRESCRPQLPCAGLDCMVWWKGRCPSWLLGFCLE